MDFKETDNDLEFDFSIISYDLDDNVEFIESEKPENIEEDIFLALAKAVHGLAEHRFVGVIDANEYFINRCYLRNNRIWENVFYDELNYLLNKLENYERIHNMLLK